MNSNFKYGFHRMAGSGMIGIIATNKMIRSWSMLWHVKKKALLIDPSPIFRHTLKAVIRIREPQVDVSEAVTVSQAKDKLQRHTYDAIFIDIALSNKNGIEFVARVKNENPHSCIVVLTDHDSAETRKGIPGKGRGLLSIQGTFERAATD